MDCGHNHCGACCGGNCCGCGRGLELTGPEIDLLRRFAQIPFLPVARRRDGEEPVYLEDGPEAAEASGAAILGLRQKQLIRLDYDIPLSNFDYSDYGQYPCQGSMALTARGQEVLDLLEIRGIEA